MTQKKATAPSKGAVATSEGNGHREIKLVGKEYAGLVLTGPAEIPFRVLAAYANDNPFADITAVEQLVGAEQMEKVWQLDITVEQGIELTRQVLAAYGLAAGESDASPKS